MSDLFLQTEASTNLPSLSRNGTILLELKRYYVSQRLNELQATLSQIRQCQLCDRKLKDGTRGCKEGDNSSDQHREKHQDPATERCSPDDHQRWSALSASQKHSPRSPESRSFLNYKEEGQISDQQRSGSLQTNIPDTLMDQTMLETKDHLH